MRILINELHQNECDRIEQTAKVGDLIINQPPMRQETDLVESRRGIREGKRQADIVNPLINGKWTFQFVITSPAQQRPRQQQQGNQRKHDTPKRQFSKINMLMLQDLQHMLKMNLVTLKDPPRNPNTSVPSYNPNARCVYHSNSPGHDTNSC